MQYYFPAVLSIIILVLLIVICVLTSLTYGTTASGCPCVVPLRGATVGCPPVAYGMRAHNVNAGDAPPPDYVPRFQVLNSLPYTLVVSDGAAWNSSHPMQPPVTDPPYTINPNQSGILFLGSWWYVKASPDGGKSFIGGFTISMKWDNGQYPYLWVDNNKIDCYGGFDSSGLIGTFKFKYHPGTTPPLQELTCNGCDTPGACGSNLPILSNDGWTSGMGNSLDEATPGKSFWTLDYGTEVERWRVDEQSKSIVQTTQKDSKTKNCGSRAYPAQIGSTLGTWTKGVGAAKSGCWQIDIKTDGKYDGKTGACITFYLAQRVEGNMAPGSPNYGDGACSGGNCTMEIDIMETGWKSLGPQWNFPKRASHSWTKNQGTDSVQAGKWSDVGGVLKDFCTFGLYIDDSSPANCWIYGYKPDGSSWYCIGPVPNNGDPVTSDFVPYIGVWTDTTGPPNYECTYTTVFDTYYRNFMYRPTSAFHSSVNPKQNANLFGPGLK